MVLTFLKDYKHWFSYCLTVGLSGPSILQVFSLAYRVFAFDWKVVREMLFDSKSGNIYP